jgi:hypothetical protein
MKIRFNRTPLQYGNTISAPSDLEIMNTPTLRQASLDTATRFGGTLTRRALDAMNLRFDRQYIVVDTKVHFLMKGWCPSVPGWHTDGVPRGKELDPAGSGLPNMKVQDEWAREGDIRPPRYHLLVSGTSSLTSFLKERDLSLFVPNEPDDNLYALITAEVNADLGTRFNKISIPDSQVVEWDWWEIHSAEWATHRGWRYLIRVTESDFLEPRKTLDDVFRYQNMAFVKSDEVGW